MAASEGSAERRGSLDAALDRLHGAEAGRARRLSEERLEPEPAKRYERRPSPRRAPAHRRQETAWQDRPAGRPRQRRPADVEVGEDEKATSAVGFLRAHGIRIERVMSDNGSAYVSAVHALACKTLGIKHLRTRPYPPRTNGKAERFIRTLLGGWAYGAIYGNCQERCLALTGWLDFSNRRRPHGSLNHQPPLRRLEALTRNNLAGSYS